MPARREVLGPDIALDAFQLFRVLGFESLAQSLNLNADEQGVLQTVAGATMGRSLIRNGSVQNGDVASVLQSFAALYRRMGLGLISSRHDGKELLVSITECAGCAGHTPGGQAICFVEAGLVSEATGLDYYGQEEQCTGGLGDDVCEFRLIQVR